MKRQWRRSEAGTPARPFAPERSTTRTAALSSSNPQGGARPTLRAYQEQGVLKILTGNTIVMLPTGAGKTLVAAEAVLRIHPQARALLLVPTCLLVAQQAAAVAEWTGRRVGQFMGGTSLPPSFDVLVCTPKAFQMAQPLHPHLAWSNFHLVIFDEVHHVMKEHPYRQLALSLRCEQHAARILGLTASLTYAVTEKHVQEAIGSICRELRIDHIATATPEELAAAGYHATAAPAEVIQVPQEEPPAGAPAATAANAVLPASERKPHLMVPTFFTRVQRGTATRFALRLVQSIHEMERSVAADVAGGRGQQPFNSPLERLPMRDWGRYALEHGARQVSAQGRQRCALLSHWYEALKLLVASWEEAEDASVMLLRMPPADGAAGGTAELEAQVQLWPPAVQAALRGFWAGVRPTYPRMEHLKNILRLKLDASPGFRGILFVEQRVMTHVLQAVIAADPHLQPRLRTACLYATSSPATASLRVTAQQARERLDAFSCGDVNLLITTVVAEEGMDVPAANCVIRFDPVLNAVSFVQGRGRARQADSSFVVLREREDRPAALLQQVEEQQSRIARSYEARDAGDHAAQEQQRQQSRERGALLVLTQHSGVGGAVQTLNLYVKKTKALLTESWVGEGVCQLKYKSPLRDVQAMGEAAGRKAAKARAAELLIQKLRAGARC